MLSPSEIHNLQSVATKAAQDAVQRADTSSSTTCISDACDAVARAIHEALSLLKQEANDGLAINKLPPELLGHVFCLTTATAKQPIRNAVRASMVCRQWRAVALCTPHIWSKLEDSARIMSLNLFRLCLERSKALPISVSCSDRWHGGALQENMARLKHLAFEEPIVAWVIRDISAPLLESLRIAGSGSDYLLPDDLFGNYAPRLTHLAVRWNILSANRQYGFLGGVTRLDLLHMPGRTAFAPDLLCLAHVLRQLPHLIVLTGVCPTEDDSSIPSNIPLANLEELHALDTEDEERFLLAPFELLQHERIPKIFIDRPSLAVDISTYRSTSPIVYAKLDRLRRQAVFRDDNGFTRTFTDCKVHNVVGDFVAISETLTTLVLCGRLHKSLARLPHFPVLRTLTVAIHSTDWNPPFAMSLRWDCPKLHTLGLSSIRKEWEESFDMQVVDDFVKTGLGVEAIEELQLDNVRLYGGVYWTSELASVKRIIRTDSVIEPVKMGGPSS